MSRLKCEILHIPLDLSFRTVKNNLNSKFLLILIVPLWIKSSGNESIKVDGENNFR